MAKIDLRQMEYFVAAAECGSFVRAAKLAHVSQPAITKAIQRMERWFGHALFERGPELKLSAFGDALLPDAKRMLEDFDILREKAEHFGREWAISLRIGAGPLVAESIVGEAVGRLLGRGLTLKCSIHVDNYAVFPAMLRDRAIDMFVADIYELKDADDLTVCKLKPSRFRWFCREGHPLAERKSVTMDDILAYPIALPELPIWAREWFAANLPAGATGSTAQPPFQADVVCSHYSTLMQVVLQSDTLSALTEMVLHRYPYASRMVALDFRGNFPSSHPGIVTLKKRALPPVARMLMEEIATMAEGK